MTADELTMLELPVEATEEAALYVDAALDWLSDHTKLKFNKEDMDSIKALPSAAKLFLCKYYEIMAAGTNVTSESIGGMSQSFSDRTKEELLWQTANGLLGGYLLSQVQSIPHVSKWR